MDRAFRAWTTLRATSLIIFALCGATLLADGSTPAPASLIDISWSDIAREVARSHGGEIVATSTEAGGTTFTIDLPRTASASSWKPVLDEAHVQTM